MRRLPLNRRVLSKDRCQLAGFVALVGLLIALGTTQTVEAGAPPGLTVMTFNIRYDNAADGVNGWRHRRDGVAKLIADRKLDVVGLQEVLANQLADLQERLPEYEAIGVGRDDGRKKGEFSPLLVRKDRLKVEKSGTFWLSETPDKPGSKSWDAALPRICTWARLTSVEGEFKDVLVASTHFDHQGPQARLASAKLITAKLLQVDQDFTAPSQRLVLLGDFNCTERDEPYLELLKAPSDKQLSFQDAYEICGAEHRKGPHSTWNGFREIVPDQRIDFIFVAGLDATAHEIIDARVGERFLSDHLPVTALVR